jgi:hypothetical protein
MKNRTFKMKRENLWGGDFEYRLRKQRYKVCADGLVWNFPHAKRAKRIRLVISEERILTTSVRFVLGSGCCIRRKGLRGPPGELSMMFMDTNDYLKCIVGYRPFYVTAEVVA